MKKIKKDREQLIMHNGQWTVDNGQLTMDNGQLTNGQWTNGWQQALILRGTNCQSLLANFLSYVSCLLLVACLVFLSCQDPSKGCLDAKATNFDVTATVTCEDNCCTYPHLTLQTDYLSDNVSKEKFKFENKYKIGLDSLQIIEGQFYLSDFQLVTPDNKIFTVIDSTLLYRQQDTLRTLSNYALVGLNKGFDFKIGSFNESRKFSKLQFKVGLNEVANKTDPKKMPAAHPLSTQRDSMYLSAEKTYIFNRIAVVKWQGQGKKDTIRFFITTPKDVVIVKDMPFIEGFDVAIPLTINYLKFIEGVNFSDPANSIKAKIVSNYDKVFSIN